MNIVIQDLIDFYIEKKNEKFLKQFAPKCQRKQLHTCCSIKMKRRHAAL